MPSKRADRTGHEAWRREWPLGLAILALAAMAVANSAILAGSHAVVLVALLAAICGVILVAATATVRHADELAHRLGEPAGTLLLTMAITGLEVAMVAFVMSTGDEKPTLARDTMFAVVMLVLNGFMGVALLAGGLRHGEQEYNLRGANTFLVMIVPLTVLGLVLPKFTRSTPGPTLSTFQMVFLSIMSVAVYSAFLFVQTRRHRGFFIEPGDAPQSAEQEHGSGRSTRFHAIMLGAYGLPLVLLAKQLSVPLDAVVLRLGAPVALGGLIMAFLVLTPESMAAIRAARANRLQRAVNVLLGSVLASIGLTIPLVIALSILTGRRLVLGLDPAEIVLLCLTLFTSTITFAAARTHLLLGCVHLLLFGASFMLLFD